MVLTTTNSIEGFRIIEYKSIVTGVSVNIKKGGFSFNMEKYYANYNETINNIQEDAFKKLKENAQQLKANAVVGILIDIETAANTGMIIVTVTGTAVSVAIDK